MPSIQTLTRFSLNSLSSCEMCTPYNQRKEASLCPKYRDVKKNPNKQALLSFPQFTITSYSLIYIILIRNRLCFIKPSMKRKYIGLFLLVSSLIKAPIYAKLILNKFVSSSPVKLCQFAFQIQSGTFKRTERNFPPL